MAKGVFTTRIGSGYDDVHEEKYHFPRTYLRAVEATVGDTIIYYEPRRGNGEMSYFATAEVTGIRTDPNDSNLYYADLINYIDFDQKIPFTTGDRYFEQALQKEDGTVSKGAFGRAVRLLPNEEFEAILAAGFAATAPWPEEAAPPSEFGEDEQAEYLIERPIITLTRAFRDRMFARSVQRAYDRRCAVTGLRLINGGGRPEVQAAHIRPVAARGPDSIRNGIALSGTMHWLFDRGLMTFEDDNSILLVERSVPPEIKALINPSHQLILPDVEAQRPSSAFLRFHRENIFKG